MSRPKTKLPIAALEQIDDLCAEFERHWQKNERPDIDAFLKDDLPRDQREVLLIELIALDLDYRRRLGESPDREDYAVRYPDNVEALAEAFAEKAPKAGFAAPSVEQLNLLFSDFKVTDLIGAGGMGAVYKAKQPGLDRTVAVKILPQELGQDVKFALRFTREARTLAKLQHANIVSVYEFGNVEDTYYFLIEYVEGSTLRELVQQRKLDPEHALAIVPQLCDALQYAHDKDVVHRDIKPENILMSVDGSVKIADFGLSRLVGDQHPQQTITATHQVVGTPRYMAPEQLEGAKQIDHRADIYSLGVVIYEMLTGELPIGRFAAPSKKAEIDVRLDEVVLRSLEKEPQRRYQAASHLKSDVQVIAATDQPDLAVTEIGSPNRNSAGGENLGDLQQQELAGRILLTRRTLIERVERSLRPLFRGQLLQIVAGIVLIAVGAQCWAPNTQVPHLLACGVIVHLYGLFMIIAGAVVAVRIKRIDYSLELIAIREKIEGVRTLRLWLGPFLGFAWWLIWLPLFAAAGFDEVVTYRNSLVPSLIVGVVGIVVSSILYWRALSGTTESVQKWRLKLASKSVQTALKELDAIEAAKIA